MVKKTKDSELNENIEDISSVATKSSTSSKGNTKIKKTGTLKKAANTKKTSTSKKVASAKKSSTSRKASTVEKAAKTSVSSKKSKTSTKSSTRAKKAATKKASSLTKSSTSKNKTPLVEYKSEYYDLPYMYNKTVVKVLAQTPKMLFIYWEISETDRKNFKKMYGDNFFEITRPVLIVFNDTMHYSFEVDVNDFANSWYLHINDVDCKYHVELGRRPYNNFLNEQHFENITNNDDSNLSNKNSNNYDNKKYLPYYVYITSSNKMTAPNNKILFDTNLQSVKFKNIKTGETTFKNIKQFVFITNLGIFSIKDLYKIIYPKENFNAENISIGNPSSGLTSSGIFSSQFS